MWGVGTGDRVRGAEEIALARREREREREEGVWLELDNKDYSLLDLIFLVARLKSFYIFLTS